VLSRWRDRADRLLTFNRARTYGFVLVALYLVAWVDVLVLGSLPLNSSGTPIGGDYIAFHAAGRLLLSGHASQLYDHAAVSAVQDSLLGGHIPGFYDAFRNPPFFALLFAPLAVLDLLPGFAVWSLLSLAALAFALWLLVNEVPWLASRWRGLVILVLAFPPVYFGLIDGENAVLSLLLYVLIYRSLVRDQNWAMGAWAALGLFKPQLFFIFPLIFLAARRWRALASYVVVALALCGLSLALVGADGLQAWLRTLLEAESGNATVNAWRMASLKSFFDLLLPRELSIPLPGPVVSLAPAALSIALVLYAAAAVALLALLLRIWTRPVPSLPLAWAFTSLVAVLVDPHLVDYDLTVLVSAGVLALALVRQLRWWAVLLYVLLLLRVQLPIGDLSIQLAVPVLAWCTYLVRRELLAACSAPSC
jgi:hypothetical protein